MQDLLKIVDLKFNKANISTDVILPNVKLLDSASKESPAFLDPKYLPFYYRLGCELKAKNVIQKGSKLGLIGASFMKGCKTIEDWLVIEDTKPFVNIIESNLKLNGCPKIEFRYLDKAPITDDEKNQKLVDIVFISEKEEDEQKLMKYMRFLWNQLKPNGLLVIDYFYDKMINQSFLNFCNVKNKEPVSFNTRYGVGVLVKQ
jgi:hypothetical protein